MKKVFVYLVWTLFIKRAAEPGSGENTNIFKLSVTECDGIQHQRRPFISKVRGVVSCHFTSQGFVFTAFRFRLRLNNPNQMNLVYSNFTDIQMFNMTNTNG